MPATRNLYAAEVVSGAGDGIFWVALVVLLADEPSFGLWLTLAVIARFAPRALLSLPAGALADRTDTVRLLVRVDLMRAGLMAVLAAMASAAAPPWAVILVVFLSYTVACPTRPALSTLVPELAGERHLAVANAALSTIRQVMTVVGPLIGTAVVVLSMPAGFAVNALTFAASALLIARLPPVRRRGQTRTVATSGGVVRRMGREITAIRRVPAVTAMVVLIAAMYFVRGAETVLHVFVIRDQLDGDPALIGVFGGAIGLGALLSVPLARRAVLSRTPVRPLLAALALTAVPTVALAIVQRTFTAAVLLVAVGVGMLLFEVVVVMTLQRVTAADKLGVTFGAVNSAANAGKLVGALVVPLLVGALGLGPALAIVAGVVVLCGVLTTPPLVDVGRRADVTRRTLDPVVARLGGLAIFEGADRSSLERLATAVAVVRPPADVPVIVEGDEPDDLYVVVEGEVRVTVGGRHLDVLGPDSWFGEIGIVDRRPRTASVTPIGATVLWRLPGAVFLDVLEESAAPPTALVEAIADRLAAHG
jgi:predicted MFS family arabinose efflux permease